MKHFSAPLFAIVLAGFCSPAVGGPLDLIKRLATPQSAETPLPETDRSAGEPTHRVALAAPRLDATAPPVEIDPPIPAGTIDVPETPARRTTDVRHTRSNRRPAESKSTVIHKFKELERKRDAWLKRTFFGR